MERDPNTRQVAGKRAELFVSNELLKRGAAVFAPVVDSVGVDLAVRGDDGQYVEVQVKSAGGAGGKDPRWFQMGRFRPRPHLFIVGVTFEGDEPSETWVLPSGVFDRFATGFGKATRDLNLDGPKDEPLRERLAVYKDRWALITEFSKYRATAADPVSLKVRLALG